MPTPLSPTRSPQSPPERDRSEVGVPLATNAPQPLVGWSKRTFRRTVRQIAKCKRCKKAHSRMAVVLSEVTERSDKCTPVSRRTWIEGNPAGRWMCGCTDGTTYRNVDGTRNDNVKCDARCTEATGHKCECSCAGKNHGASHSEVQS